MGTRGIETAHLSAPRRVAGPSGDLCWVDIDDLLIDEDYQRPIGRAGWRAIRRMAENFDWRFFAPVLVARREGDGRLFLIDGQHRTHAAQLAGASRVPACVQNMRPQQEAAAFSAVNGDITRMDSLQVYRAALASGRDWAVRAKAAVEAAGCTLMTHRVTKGGQKPGEVYSIREIRRHIEADRDAAVTRALGALTDGWPDAPGDLYNGSILSAWLDKVAQRPHLSRAQLAAFIAENDLLDFEARAHSLRRQERYRSQSVKGLIELQIRNALDTSFGRAAG